MLHTDSGPFGSVREEDDAHTGILTNSLINERVRKDSGGLMLFMPGGLSERGNFGGRNIPSRHGTSKVKALESEDPSGVNLRCTVLNSLGKEWAVDLHEFEFNCRAKGFKGNR